MNEEPNPNGSHADAQVEPSRKFQGVWIPASLWLRKDLTWFQKCLLAEIACLGECFASNAYLARMMGTTPANIANEISKLRQKKLILDWGFDGRRRQITVAREVHPNPFGEGSATTEGRLKHQLNKDTRRDPRGLKKTKETSPDGDEVEVIPTWIPDERTKAQKLKTLRVPKGMPSERQFDLFLDQEDLGQILNYRPDLYDRLTTEKWHQWNERYQKWIPIRNWQEYVRALDGKIEKAF